MRIPEESFGKEQQKFFDEWAQENIETEGQLQNSFWSFYNNFVTEQLEFLGTLSSFRVCLDLGCGTGKNFPILSKYARTIIGIDISEQSIRYANKFDGQKTNLMMADGGFLPFRQDIFDGIVVVHVLHHTLDFRRILRETLRVIKPGGYMLLIDLTSDNPLVNLGRKLWPSFPKIAQSRVADLNVHSKIPEKTSFSKREFKCELTKLGFNTIESDNRHLFLFCLFYISRILPTIQRLLPDNVLFPIYRLEKKLLGGFLQRFAHVIITITKADK